MPESWYIVRKLFVPGGAWQISEAQDLGVYPQRLIDRCDGGSPPVLNQ
jgi:hypothetical protein